MRSFFLNRYRNHKKYLAKMAMAAAAAAGLVAGSAQAASITVPNADFETHPTPGPPNFGAFGVGTSTPPWTGTGQWAGNGYASAAYNGGGFSWVDFGQTFTQTLTLADSGTAYAWAEGTYKLNGFLADKFNGGTHTNYQVLIELRNGTTDAVLGSASTTTGTVNTWNAFNEVLVNIGAGNPNIGAPIKIVFTGTGNGDEGNQHRLLDAISLTVVPEPGSLSLISMGIAGLGFIARRRRRL